MNLPKPESQLTVQSEAVFFNVDTTYGVHPLYYAIRENAEVGKPKLIKIHVPYERSLRYATETGQYEEEQGFVFFKSYVNETPFIVAIFEDSDNQTKVLIEDRKSFYQEEDEEFERLLKERDWGEVAEKNLRKMQEDGRIL